jgi:hypothetical protein
MIKQAEQGLTMRFKFFTGASMKMAPGSPTEVNRRFGDRYCLYHQGDDGVRTSETYISTWL